MAVFLLSICFRFFKLYNVSFFPAALFPSERSCIFENFEAFLSKVD